MNSFRSFPPSLREKTFNDFLYRGFQSYRGSLFYIQYYIGLFLRDGDFTYELKK